MTRTHLARFLAFAMIVTVPVFAQNTADTTSTKQQLKSQEKADKAQAKADKAERKALGTKQQKKADKAQDKANQQAEKTTVPPL